MVTITNGIITTQVTSGAFQSLFKGMGYVVVDEKIEKPTELPDANENKGEMSADDKFVAELVEKPIGEWDKNEVKKFAKIKGVDISGTKSIDDAKAIIKEFMNA